MAAENKRIAELTTLSAANVDVNEDFIPVVDVDDTTQGPDGTTKKMSPRSFVVAVGARQGTGVDLEFNGDGVYGTPGATESATPIQPSLDSPLTAPQLGSVVVLFHNRASEPVFDAAFIKLSGSGDYVINVLNIIMFMYIDDTHIYYTIQQLA